MAIRLVCRRSAAQVVWDGHERTRASRAGLGRYLRREALVDAMRRLMIRLCAAWRKTSLSRTTGFTRLSMMYRSTMPIPHNLSVRPNQTEGIRWTFMAATNFHASACWNTGKALRQGLGASTNLVAAYAWLSLFANTTPGSIVGRSQVNDLARARKK